MYHSSGCCSTARMMMRFKNTYPLLRMLKLERSARNIPQNTQHITCMRYQLNSYHHSLSSTTSTRTSRIILRKRWFVCTMQQQHPCSVWNTTIPIRKLSLTSRTTKQLLLWQQQQQSMMMVSSFYNNNNFYHICCRNRHQYYRHDQNHSKWCWNCFSTSPSSSSSLTDVVHTNTNNNDDNGDDDASVFVLPSIEEMDAVIDESIFLSSSSLDPEYEEYSNLEHDDDDDFNMEDSDDDIDGSNYDIERYRSKTPPQPSKQEHASNGSLSFHMMNHDHVNISPQSTPVRKSSLVEGRYASQQLHRMVQMTNEILHQSSYETLPVNRNQLRTIYLYWLSRPVRDIYHYRDTLDDNSPLRYANQILHWLMNQLDHVAITENDKHNVASITEHVLLNSNQQESTNAALCRLMSLFTLSLQGTKAAIEEYGRRTIDNPKSQIQHLLSASRIYHIMKRVHADNVYFPNIQPDLQSYQSILNLHGKRCKLLALLGPKPKSEGVQSPRIRRGIRWSDPDTIEAFGGCRTTRECISNAIDVINEMKHNPNVPNPSMIHYSMLLSMMSYSAGLNIGMADEAYSILQDLESDSNIIMNVALYNSVLLAYALEINEHTKKKRWEQQQLTKQKCEMIWNHMKNHANSDLCHDPVTYSIMMKMYRNIGDAATAQEILECMEVGMIPTSTDNMMVETSQRTKNLPPFPSLVHYNTVLTAWTKSNDPQAGERAMALVRRMEGKIIAKTGLQHLNVPLPDQFAYTSVIDAMLRGPIVDGMMTRMEQVLQNFESCEASERRPDFVTYNVIFHTLFRRLQSHSDLLTKRRIVVEMEDLLKRLMNTSQNFRMVAGQRIYRYYNDCLRAWVHAPAPDATERAMALFRDMDETGRNGMYPASIPNGTTYQHLFAIISNLDDTQYVDACKELFIKMETTNVPVTVTALNIYIKRFLHYRFAGSIEEADDAFVESFMERFRAKETRDDAFTAAWVFEGLFSEIRRESDAHLKSRWASRFEKLFRALLKEPHHLQINQDHSLTFYYNNCIRAWAFARAPDSTANVLRILLEMEERCKDKIVGSDDPKSCQPDMKTYEYILTSLTRAPDSISVKTAREIFHKIEAANFPINLSIMNLFIKILSKSGVRGSLQEAESILKILEDDFLAGRDGSICPNQQSYSFIVEGHLKSFEGLRNAERIMDHMKNISTKTGVTELRPSPKLYLDLISHWSNSVAIEAVERIDSLFQQLSEIVKPNSHDYATLQAAWGRSKRNDAPQHVESILVLMQQEYENRINPSSRPTIENFELVIKTWATSKKEGSAERADAILQRLEELCYSDHGSYNDLRPSTSCYQYALLGWTLSESPIAGERVVDLLSRMKRYQKTNRDAPPINQACYHHAILAIGKSNQAHKAKKCYAIVEEMRYAYETRRNRYSWPTHETYRSILGICATCNDSLEECSEAVQVCQTTMKDYLQLAHGSARKDVYVQFLYAAFRLLPPGDERDRLVLSIFDDETYKCPAAIFDNWSVRDGLLKTVSPKIFADIARVCGRNPLLKSLTNNRVRFT